ncbi:MAG: ATPase, partial [Bacteroidetes bacterium]
MLDKFIETINQGYQFKGESIILGGAMLDNKTQTGTLVKLPLKMLNRHGLIAGATGSGKTKTLQIIAEQLSEVGVPSLLMDIKGDLSGIAVASAGHAKIDERHAAIGIPFRASGSPVELLTISKEKGVRMRATVSEF